MPTRWIKFIDATRLNLFILGSVSVSRSQLRSWTGRNRVNIFIIVNCGVSLLLQNVWLNYRSLFVAKRRRLSNCSRNQQLTAKVGQHPRRLEHNGRNCSLFKAAEYSRFGFILKLEKSPAAVNCQLWRWCTRIDRPRNFYKVLNNNLHWSDVPSSRSFHGRI